MTALFDYPRLDAYTLATVAIAEHEPVRTFALVSGGKDSMTLLSWALKVGVQLDAAVFIDTGTAIPGVREFVTETCAAWDVRLLVYEAGDEYARLVRERGFPGPGAHRFAYVRLKERQLDRLIREHKTARTDRIVLLTGVRRSESTRRMGTTAPLRRDGATVWVAPLIDWTDEDMRAWRDEHDVPTSDVAALLCRSGECNCGAFATPGERDELRSLYPEWFAATIAPLEAETGTRWGERPNRTEQSEGGPLCGSCDARQERLTMVSCTGCGVALAPTNGSACANCCHDPVSGWPRHPRLAGATTPSED